MWITLFFDAYWEAIAFMRKVGSGKVSPRPLGEGYIWVDDPNKFSDATGKAVAAYATSEFAWHDHETGLSWLIGYEKSFPLSIGRLDRINETRHFGFGDWRVPTLWELKTLATDRPNSFGIYAKESLADHLSGNFNSSTWIEGQSAWWSFESNAPTQEDAREGKIRWGAEGAFAGFDPDRSTNSSRTILVRGEHQDRREGWVGEMIRWAKEANAAWVPLSEDSLAEIDTFYTHADTLPSCLDQLPNLREICCYYRPSMTDALSRAVQIKTLRLQLPYKAERQPFPDQLCRLSALRRLESEATCDLPSNVAELAELEELSTNTKNIPSSIGRLRNLRTLLLSGSFEQVPDSIGDLSSLERLSLAGSFTSLPASLRRLAGLRELGLATSRESELPDIVGALPRLRVLTLSGRFRRLPASLGSADALEVLRVYCEFDEPVELPPTIDQLRALKEVRLKGVQETPASTAAFEALGLKPWRDSSGYRIWRPAQG